MQSAPLESGILKIFRFFLVVQLLLLLANIAAHTEHHYLKGDPSSSLVFGVIGIFLLLGYLSWPWLQKKLGRFYLSIALMLSATFSLVLQNIFLDIRLSATAGSREETAWTLFMFLFIPLMLVSWQYNFKAVLGYCLYTVALDAALLHFFRADFHLYLDTYTRLLLIRVISFLVTGYVIARIMGQLREQRTALQQANQKLAHYASTLEQLTVSRERNRMARELHDTVAHSLSGLAVQLEGVKSLWKSDLEQSYAMLETSLAATRSGLIETRKAIQSLRATPLEDMGIVLAVRQLAEAAADRSGFTLHFKQSGLLSDLPPDVAQCFYRVAQEGLENIVRHAAAQNVELRLSRQNNEIQLRIRDDGLGFDPATIDQGQHYGLRGLRERADLLGAKLAIKSAPGRGTTIRLTVENDD
jgi:signal transduction histidine kinase